MSKRSHESSVEEKNSTKKSKLSSLTISNHSKDEVSGLIITPCHPRMLYSKKNNFMEECNIELPTLVEFSPWDLLELFMGLQVGLYPDIIVGVLWEYLNDYSFMSRMTKNRFLVDASNYDYNMIASFFGSRNYVIYGVKIARYFQQINMNNVISKTQPFMKKNVGMTNKAIALDLLVELKKFEEYRGIAKTVFITQASWHLNGGSCHFFDLVFYACYILRYVRSGKFTIYDFILFITNKVSTRGY